MLQVEDLQFEVRESPARETLEIMLDRDGSLVLACPARASEQDRIDFIQKKLVWVYTKLEQKEEHEPLGLPKEYVNGEGFYYLGRHYRLKIIPPVSQKPPLRLYHGRFQLRQDEHSRARENFITWYRSHLEPILQRKVAQYRHRVEAVPQAFHVRDLGYRWGSTDKRGHLYFHWRAAMLPIEMIEYIVVHEMVHLVEAKHSPAFWERVERIIPDYRDKKHWLALKGGRYDL
jgi:predicted metal-dependent hydrolase